MTNKEKAIALVEAFSTGNPKVLDYISDEKYIQHNLSFPDGKSALNGFFSGRATGIDVTIHRAFEDGNLVALHSTYAGVWNDGVPQVAFDVFRFEDGKAVEHWDNLLEVKGKNTSGRTQTDGVTEITDLDKTTENKKLLTRFVNECLIGNDYSKVTEIISTEIYDQHNPDGTDGLDGFNQFVQYLKDNNIDMIYSNCYHIIVEGNFALVLTDGTYGGQDVAYYDLFRVEDGLIVEHWDVVSSIPPKSEWNNENGKF